MGRRWTSRTPSRCRWGGPWLWEPRNTGAGSRQVPKQMQVGRFLALGTKKGRGRQQAASQADAGGEVHGFGNRETQGRQQAGSRCPQFVPHLVAVLPGSSSRRSCCRGLQTTGYLKAMPVQVTVSCTKAAAISCPSSKCLCTSFMLLFATLTAALALR